MNMLFVSALLLVRNESKEFTIASTRIRGMYGTRTDIDSHLGLFLFFIYYNKYYKFCPSLYRYGWYAKVDNVFRQLVGYKGGVLAVEVGRSLL